LGVEKDARRVRADSLIAGAIVKAAVGRDKEQINEK